MGNKTRHKGKASFTCQMCTASFSNAPVYEMQFMITDITLDVCRKCAYRERFGNKNWKKQMKKGVLDG